MTRICIITGPTASGKSAIALEIAQKKRGVIINADSQQMYCDLPILTARPTAQEEALVPHKLYGILQAEQSASAGMWLRHARMEIDWALSQGMLPIVVGGTGLYIKALMQGIAEMPDIAPEVRAQAISDYEEMGKEAFAERLRHVDPAFFERLKVQDKQRLVRAYEIWLGSAKSLSWWQGQGTTPLYPIDYFELYKVELLRDELYSRCNERFTAMVERGAVDEVAALFPPPLRGRAGVGGALHMLNPLMAPPTLTLPLKGGGNIIKIIGVREIAAFLHGETTLPQAIEKAQQATRNYAKRQVTWIRHQLPGAKSIGEMPETS